MVDYEHIRLRNNANNVKFIKYVYDNREIPNGIDLSNDDLFLIEVDIYDTNDNFIEKNNCQKRIKSATFERDYNEYSFRSYQQQF